MHRYSHLLRARIRDTDADLILLQYETLVPGQCNIIHRIRQNKSTRNTPVIFIASANDSNIIGECLNFESTDFVTLPLREKELILRIRHQLSLIEAQRTIKQQNEQLQQTLQARDKLYSVIAHDLRSPIGTIKMINAAIETEKEKITNPSIRKKFEMINETTEEAYNLLENLLRWTRNRHGKTKVIPTLFDLSIATRQVLSLFTTIAKAKNIRLTNQLLHSLPVYADEDMIKTVLRNLISNAIKFTYPDGNIELYSTVEKDYVTIAIKDNGQGIKKEDQKYLLQENHSVSTYGTRNEKGSGLGLILSQEFIKLNNGKLYFTSAEGQGTTFYFALPKAKPQSPMTQ
ncbi:sensor histidine kinase [Odoribacter sp. OF09-27XD]|nr:sensor histidine kinase [Odoribacter sp. OF09-27XD]